VQVHRPVGERQVHAHLGIALVELNEGRRQVLHAEGDGGVDAQQPAGMAGGGGNLVLEPVHGLDQPLARVEVGLPFRRQRQLARRAVDEPHAEPAFQPRDELGYRRRREAQVAGGAGEGAALDGTHEHAHLRELIHRSCLQFTKEVPRRGHPLGGFEHIYRRKCATTALMMPTVGGPPGYWWPPVRTIRKRQEEAAQ
jgi:hypothetical protein